MYIFLALIIFIGSGVFCHYIAKSRGVNPVFWGVMGVMFGPVAIPFAWMSKPAKEKKQ